MNYAKEQPELVILAVNTFVKVRLPSFTRLRAARRPYPPPRPLSPHRPSF